MDSTMLMKPSMRRFVTGFAALVIVLIIAVVGYVIMGWGVLEAIYMVVITVAGVGYGEVRPLDSPELRVFTIVVIVAGMSAVVYTLGGFVEMVAEGEIKRALGERRKTKEIERLRDHVIICGFGRMGQIIAEEVASASMPFVVIESDEERVALADDLGYLALSGSATEEDILESAGVARAKMLAIVLPQDADNVFITLSARNMNPSLDIIARGEVSATEPKLLQAGANHVVLPATTGGLRIAHMITHPDARGFLEKVEGAGDLTLELYRLVVALHDVPIPNDSPLVGRPVGELRVEGESPFLVVAVRRKDGTTIPRPDADVAIQTGDTAVVLGLREDVPHIVLPGEMAGSLRGEGERA